MATLYKRLIHYCHINKQRLPSLEERKDLGKQIVIAWYAQEKIAIKRIAKVKTIEPEGEFTTLSYPSFFTNKIDEIIDNYYKIHSPPVKKDRKRVPIKKPAYQARKPKPLK